MSSDRPDHASGRPLVVLDRSHPIQIGETVTVIRFGLSTPPFIEGRGAVKNIAQGPHCYRVQFIGDPVLRERVVHREYQSDPEQMLSMMLDLWRADNPGSLAGADFFPGDDSE